MDVNDTLILGFPENEQQARALAESVHADFCIVDLHRFPDEESLVRIPEKLPKHIILMRSLDHPNTKLIELMLTSVTARRLGAEQIVLVAPYLCYMRQDKAFHPGESISQRIVGEFIAKICDVLITVDPHLHRVHQLSDTVPTKKTLALTAAPLFDNFLAERIPDAFLLGPDEESEQWVAKIAKNRGLDYAIANKTRQGDRDVRLQLPEIDLHKRNVVIIDDIASSGITLAAAVTKALAAGASSVNALVMHALFVEGAITQIQKAGIEEIWSTDSIPHASNVVSLLPLLADAVSKIIVTTSLDAT